MTERIFPESGVILQIAAEWDRLTEVMVHEPEIEIEYAMLSPRPFLFERIFRTSKAVEEHRRLQETLKGEGVKVSILRQLIVGTADEDPAFRRLLEDKVRQLVIFYGSRELSEKAKEEFRKNISGLDSLNLFHILTLEPAINLKKTADGTPNYPTIYSNIPLANLYFMRDQQAVGNRGVIVGNMRSLQRRKETEITEFVLKNSFRVGNVSRIEGEDFFEGGDFIPARDFALIGIGTRTNRSGALAAMQSGMLDFKEIGVVENPLYSFMEGAPRDPMVNMHLDTYFNIADSGVAVTSVELAKKAETEVFVREGTVYKSSGKTRLYDFLKDRGYSFVDLSVAEQVSYSSNFLTISGSKIVAVRSENVLRKLLGDSVLPQSVVRIVKESMSSSGTEKMFPFSKAVKEHGIDAIDLDLSELTGGYGGAHCMTASLSRN